MASKSPSLLPNILRRQSWRPLRTRATPRFAASPTAAPPSPFAWPSLSPTALPAYPSRAIRLAHSIPRPPPVQPREPASSPNETEFEADKYEDGEERPLSEGSRPDVPQNSQAYYQISFTCVPCSHRSHHNVSKQGYHTGSILITCPECHNRHVISDHLNIFGDRKITIEDLMREKGQLVKRGSLGEDGDIEFWPDEEQTPTQATGEAGESKKTGGS